MKHDGLDINGLDELSDKLLAAIDDFPGTAERGLVSMGNKLKKKCVAHTPQGATGKLKKGWKHTVTGYNGTELTYELTNHNPVHHLLNNGHVKKTRSGKTVGYYEGLHYKEKAVKLFTAEDLESSMQTLAKKLIKKVDSS